MVAVKWCMCFVMQEEAQEEFGWKLVHGDVFRPPRKGMMLSVLLGNGLQIFVMVVVTLGVCLDVSRTGIEIYL